MKSIIKRELDELLNFRMLVFLVLCIAINFVELATLYDKINVSEFVIYMLSNNVFIFFLIFPSYILQVDSICKRNELSIVVRINKPINMVFARIICVLILSVIWVSISLITSLCLGLSLDKGGYDNYIGLENILEFKKVFSSDLIAIIVQFCHLVIGLLFVGMVFCFLINFVSDIIAHLFTVIVFIISICNQSGIIETNFFSLGTYLILTEAISLKLLLVYIIEGIISLFIILYSSIFWYKSSQYDAL